MKSPQKSPKKILEEEDLPGYVLHSSGGLRSPYGDLNEKTVAFIKEIAKKRKIAGISKMRKAELINSIDADLYARHTKNSKLSGYTD